MVIEVGTRVCLSGGYDMEPRWLGGRPAVSGVVERFIPGQNERPAAVVRLDSPLTVDNVTGDYVVLELRHVGATWESGATAHVELCSFSPEAKRWQERRQGRWVESHATVGVA